MDPISHVEADSVSWASQRVAPETSFAKRRISMRAVVFDSVEFSVDPAYQQVVFVGYRKSAHLAFGKVTKVT